MKKRGFGAGKWNGYGGKVEGEESEKTATVRELMEESNLLVQEKDLKQVALIHFHFENELVFICSVYTTNRWIGEPIETEEMNPRWFNVNELPFNEMWVADAKWIPLILNRQTIEVEVYFNKDGSKVEDFKYKLFDFN